jgi:hypothetical protein
MARLCSGRKSEAEEEVECALNPERPRYLKRSEAGKKAGVMGSAMPNSSVTAPLLSRHARPREGNCNGSWEEPTGRATDVSSAMPRDISKNYYGDRKVQAMGRYAAALRLVIAWVRTSKQFKFRGARRRPAAAEQPRAGSVLEPVRPETVGRTVPGLDSETTTSELHKGP